MTFEEAKNDILAHYLRAPNEAFYNNVLTELYREAREIANLFAFPRLRFVTVLAPDGTISLNTGNVGLGTVSQTVLSVAVNGVGLQRFKEYERYELAKGMSGPAFGWYFDTGEQASDTVLVAPNDGLGKDAVLVLQRPYGFGFGLSAYNAYNPASEIWGRTWVADPAPGYYVDALYPSYHDTVLLGALVRLWKQGFQNDKAESWRAEYLERMKQFSFEHTDAIGYGRVRAGLAQLAKSNAAQE